MGNVGVDGAAWMAAANGGRHGSTRAPSPMRLPAPRSTCAWLTRRVTSGLDGNRSATLLAARSVDSVVRRETRREAFPTAASWRRPSRRWCGRCSRTSSRCLHQQTGRPRAKKLANQTVPKEGKLCDLRSDSKEHSKLYMAHHSIAKWQRHCHGRCLETFRDGDLAIETDFAEKYTHQSYISMMMPVYPQTTLMVAIVHFNPQTHVGGGRVHVTETWIFASKDMAHDCDFHLHGLARIADHYLRGNGSEATAAARKEGRTPRIHMFTDGCGKQYKGRRNFRFLADSARQIGFFIDHHFAATSHFKGCHDGIGGVAKNAMKRRERFGKRIMGADGVVSFLRSFFREKAGSEGEEGMRKYFAKWSPYRMRRVHVEFIGKKEIYRPNSTLEGIEGTLPLRGSKHSSARWIRLDRGARG
ncbi:unnamed protein product [Pylaiella littoralis]